MKSIIRQLVCLVIVFSLFFPSHSMAIEISPQSVATQVSFGFIQHTGSGNMKCQSQVTLWSGFRANIEMKLQRKTTSGTW